MLEDLISSKHVVAGAPGVEELRVSAAQWREVAQDLGVSGARLLSLWTSWNDAATVRAAFLARGGLLVLTLALPHGESAYASVADLFPSADRLQRAAADLTGIRALDADTRPWLRHAAWPSMDPPLHPASRDEASYPAPATVDQYAFVRVAGDGVHEIPVGPVHAGIIEPGHFRFSIVGEKVLRLEERLGYVHKGVERLFMQTPPGDGHRLAARVSGDSAVAYSWAYCQALEGICGIVIPDRAAWLRALALESERMANHLGDLGALGNDAGFAFGLAQMSRLKEIWLRQLQRTLGQRYLLDVVVPGGVHRDATPADLSSLTACAQRLGAEAATIREIYDEHTGVRDRFAGAGVVSPELARQLGLIGAAGRASGQDHDLRVDLPCEPYAQLDVRKALRTDGDVAARVQLRFEELMESIRLVELIVARMPQGRCSIEMPAAPPDAAGVGLIEGWRGPVMIWLETGADGAIRRCHPHDPSWQNWPVLEHAIIGNIVPDFPLINKSFNLSYSGHDL